ncbi:MAG: hypothetical protein HY757_00240 [Nitrospirae bacterium]|nr:hypothetical protein [Nitrospirota bacterium]
MKYAAVFVIILALLFGVFSEVNAWRRGKPVTPYGDFCPRCTQYGSCKSIMSHNDAKKAMIDYYQEKGLGVELENINGRFIRARIKEADRVIDVIIFDRRTGRVRSIY